MSRSMADAEGVLIAHGDATSGYSLYIKDGLLVHDLNIGGGHEIVRSTRKVPAGAHRLGVHVERLVRKEPPAKGSRTGISEYTLLIDGEPAGSLQTQLGFHTLISWSGLDIGRDRGSPVSHYDAPFAFTGKLLKVTVEDAQRPDARRRGRRQRADGKAVIIVIASEATKQSSSPHERSDMRVPGCRFAHPGYAPRDDDEDRYFIFS